MIEAKPAPVKPRVVSPQTGEIILLEDVVRELLDEGFIGQIWIVGPAGAGKTTAISHLAAIFSSANSSLELVDSPSSDTVRNPDVLVICTAASTGPGISRAYRLAPWTTDDLIEYLLCKHKELCPSVMDRIKTAPDRGMALGNPELWGIILNQMASDESILDIRSALLDYLDTKIADLELRKLLQAHSFSVLMAAEALAAQSLAEMKIRGLEEALLRIARHRSIQVLLAAEQIAADLANDSPHCQLATPMPRELVREVANQIQSDSNCIAQLKKAISESIPEVYSLAPSILHWVDPTWVPSPNSVRALGGNFLDHVNWPGVNLEKVNLRGTDLSHANLEHANLCGADVFRAHFQSASLRGAFMQGILANEATLAEADLSGIAAEKAQIHSADLRQTNLEGAILIRASLHGSNLTRTRFALADLRQANLRGANIEDADFSGANLEGACLSRLKLAQATFIGSNLAKADLTKCDLEYMDLADVIFRGTNLEGALLTGSSIRNGDFNKARLCDTGLADINWEGANLREADLTGATFHMGSSRSGLVGSPIASEGTRTGFYTDDYTEQDFKSPEEIRKANLCGADLRGAKIEGVDFYLVDLRNALYDADQEAHFRRCGAILETRA